MEALEGANDVRSTLERSSRAGYGWQQERKKLANLVRELIYKGTLQTGDG